MLDNEYALISLFRVVPQIKGRKKLQKTVYLLQRAGLPYNEKFRYHHYGPYSSELQAKVDRLVDYGMLNENFDGDIYVYEITDKGKEFLQLYGSLAGSGFDLPEHLVKRLVGTSTPVLEMTSTYAYLLEMGYDKDEALTKASMLKPNLDYCLNEAQVLYDEI